MATQLLKTVKPSGGDYTSLEACMNANEQDLVAADKYFDVEIDGDWSGGADTTAVIIHNYTTDATRYINIYTTSAARHRGLYSTSYYVLDIAGSGNCLSVQNTYVTITGIQIDGNATRGGVVFYSNFTFQKNIVKDASAGGESYYVIPSDSSVTGCSIINNICHGLYRKMRVDAGTHSFYNNTCVGAADYQYLFVAGTITAKNNIAQDGTTGDYYLGVSITSADNISEDASSPDSEWRNKTVTFVGASDFHLDASDASGAIDGGTDLSGIFTDDIDGVTRTGTWDIGADEFVAVGGASPQPALLTPRGGYWGF